MDRLQVRSHAVDLPGLSATVESVRLISLHHPIPHYPKLANPPPLFPLNYILKAQGIDEERN